MPEGYIGILLLRVEKKGVVEVGGTVKIYRLGKFNLRWRRIKGAERVRERERGAVPMQNGP